MINLFPFLIIYSVKNILKNDKNKKTSNIKYPINIVKFLLLSTVTLKMLMCFFCLYKINVNCN